MSEGRAARPAAERTVQIDNDHVRVSHWRFAAEAATGWHRHELDYVIVPLMAGTLRLDDGQAVTIANLEAAQSYYRPAGVEHDVSNASGHEFRFRRDRAKERRVLLNRELNTVLMRRGGQVLAHEEHTRARAHTHKATYRASWRSRTRRKRSLARNGRCGPERRRRRQGPRSRGAGEAVARRPRLVHGLEQLRHGLQPLHHR
jgi:mannose-6-phosphate isomerase-like protein (cupin superfamily)